MVDTLVTSGSVLMAQLLDWNPLASNCTAIEALPWFMELMFYGLKEDAPLVCLAYRETLDLYAHIYRNIYMPVHVICSLD